MTFRIIKRGSQLCQHSSESTGFSTPQAPRIQANRNNAQMFSKRVTLDKGLFYLLELGKRVLTQQTTYSPSLSSWFSDMTVFSFAVSKEMLCIWAGFSLGLRAYWSPVTVKSRLPSAFSERKAGLWKLIVIRILGAPGAELWEWQHQHPSLSPQLGQAWSSLLSFGLGLLISPSEFLKVNTILSKPWAIASENTWLKLEVNLDYLCF